MVSWGARYVAYLLNVSVEGLVKLVILIETLAGDTFGDEWLLWLWIEHNGLACQESKMAETSGYRYCYWTIFLTHHYDNHDHNLAHPLKASAALTTTTATIIVTLTVEQELKHIISSSFFHLPVGAV